MMGWREAIHGIGGDVYLLFYVRIAFRDGVNDGTESTPYERDHECVSIARNQFSHVQLINVETSSSGQAAESGLGRHGKRSALSGDAPGNRHLAGTASASSASAPNVSRRRQLAVPSKRSRGNEDAAKRKDQTSPARGVALPRCIRRKTSG